MLLLWYLKIELHICCLKVRYQRMGMESKNKMFLFIFINARVSRPEGNYQFYSILLLLILYFCIRFSVEISLEAKTAFALRRWPI